MIIRYIITGVLVFLLTSAIAVIPVQATRSQEISLPCPVCGDTVEVSGLLSSNSFGGRDTDFLTHAVGANPVEVLVSTCSHCLYSGTRADFEDTSAVILRDELLTEKPLLIPASLDGTAHDAGKLPAWARWILAAQCSQRRHSSPRLIADRWLSASWAMRLDSGMVLGSIPGLTQVEQQLIVDNFKPSTDWEKRNRSQIDLESASRMIAALESDTVEIRRPAAWLAVNLLWKRGEIEPLLKNLDRLAPLLDPNGMNGTFAVQLVKTVERVRGCQRNAREEFLKNTEGTPVELLTYRYLAAELSRRLGETTAVELANVFSDPAAPVWFKMLQADVEYNQKVFTVQTK